MEEKPNQGDNHKDGDKAKGGTSRKEPSKPAENAITNANDLKSFGNLNRLRNIDKKKVETDLLSKVSKSSPAIRFGPNVAVSKEKPVVSAPIIQFKPKSQIVQTGRDKRKSAPLPSTKGRSDQDMLIDAPDLSKREKRVFKVEDIAPTALEMGIDAMNLSHPVTLPFTAAKAESIADEQTIRNNQKKQHFKENELLFFQFPSIMPFANEVVDKKEEKPKEDPGHMRYDNGFANTLQHIKEGKIGKMYILKSGKVKLQIGDNMFEVAQGMPCSFLQELHYLNLSSKEIFNLGDIDKRIVVTPDFEDLLKKKTGI